MAICTRTSTGWKCGRCDVEYLWCSDTRRHFGYEHIESVHLMSESDGDLFIVAIWPFESPSGDWWTGPGRYVSYINSEDELAVEPVARFTRRLDMIKELLV